MMACLYPSSPCSNQAPAVPPSPHALAFGQWRRLLAGLTAGSRHRVTGLIRLAYAVEGHSDCADALWRVVRQRDDTMHGHRITQWAQRLFREAYLPPDPPPPILRQQPDPRPGCYYVSSVDGGSRGAPQDSRRHWLVAGPYATHAEALGLVQAVREHAQGLDPRAHWMAWGTARTDEPEKTLLGPWHPPEPAVEIPRARRAKRRTVAAYSHASPEVDS